MFSSIECEQESPDAEVSHDAEIKNLIHIQKPGRGFQCSVTDESECEVSLSLEEELCVVEYLKYRSLPQHQAFS